MNLTGLPPQGVNFSKSTASRQPSVQPSLLFGGRFDEMVESEGGKRNNEARKTMIHKQMRKIKEAKADENKRKEELIAIGDTVIFTSSEGKDLTMVDVLVHLFETESKRLDSLFDKLPDPQATRLKAKPLFDQLKRAGILIHSFYGETTYGLSEKGALRLQFAYPDLMPEEGFIYVDDGREIGWESAHGDGDLRKPLNETLKRYQDDDPTLGRHPNIHFLLFDKNKGSGSETRLRKELLTLV